MTVYIKKLTFPSQPEAEQSDVEVGGDAPPIDWDQVKRSTTHDDKFFAVDARVGTGTYSPGDSGS